MRLRDVVFRDASASAATGGFLSGLTGRRFLVRRSVGSGIRVRGPGGRPGRFGDGGVGGSTWSPASSVAVTAGFRRSKATFSAPLPGMESL